VIGYGRKAYAGKRSAGASIPVTWLLPSILLVVLPVIALRVAAAMPISLKANWIMQMTQVRSEMAYRRAVRLSWLTMTVLPMELLAGAILLWTYPIWASWMHLALLPALGLLTVEICLITFVSDQKNCLTDGNNTLSQVSAGCLIAVP
jgi:hypothetical protein